MKTTKMLAVGNFNEDASTKNAQDFVAETGLCDAISEAHNIEEINRDGIFEHRTKCKIFRICRSIEHCRSNLIERMQQNS